MFKAILLILVVFFDIEIYGVKLDNIVVLGSLFFTLPWMSFKLFKFYLPAIISIGILFALFLYSYVIRNNEFDDIIVFMRPVMVLFLVRWLSRDFRLDMFLALTSICFFIYSILFLIVSLLPEAGWVLAELFESLDFEIRNGVPRLLWKLVILIHIIQCYILFKSNVSELVRVMLYCFSLGIVYISGSYGLFLGSIFIAFLAWRRSVQAWIFSGVILICLGLTIPVDKLIERKAYSFKVKLEQVEALASVNMEDIILGKGMGSRFRSFDSRKSDDLFLEVSPIMLIINYGILGGIGISFIYLLLPLVLAFNHKELRWLLAAQFAIVLSSFTNPYIWSGFVGLLVPLLIFRHAYIYYNTSLQG